MYSPTLNPGTPPLKLTGAPTQSPFSIYSDKQIVSSSQPVRDNIARVGVMADDLEQQLNEFKQQASNNIVLNNLLQQGT